MSNYKYVLIDEFGGAIRKFASKVEATPYLTNGTRLEALPKVPKVNLYQQAMLLLGEAPF
jgi:sRNA-binding regulator protein Hfq